MTEPGERASVDSSGPESPPTAPEPSETGVARVPLGRRVAEGLATGPVRNVVLAALVLVGWSWMVARFLWLESSPPGFFMDEATPAVHAMCLAETGMNIDEEAWPLYSHAAGGGHHPLTLLAFDVVWMKVFGTSRAAFRAVSAFFILLTCAGVLLLARELSARIPLEGEDERSRAAVRAFPWLVLFASLLSPWGFQFSRVGWEAPLAPAFLVLGMVAFLRGLRRPRAFWAWSAVAGLGAAAAMITYPPMRATAPLAYVAMVVLLRWVTREAEPRRRLVKAAVTTLVVTGACMLPTLRMLGQGKINERMNNIAIWRPDFVNDRIGSAPRWLFYAEAFLDNVAAYLRPSFLFFRGDRSLRHSPQIIGHLSPVDALALVLVAGALCAVTWRMLRGRAPAQRARAGAPAAAWRWLVAIALTGLFGAFLGVVPAALTFDEIPHALRAIGAWPFIALATGGVLAVVHARRAWVTPLLALVSLGYTLWFFPSYFRAYDQAENHWFMREMTDLLESRRRVGASSLPEKAIAENMGYSYEYYEVPMYYLMTEARMGCRRAKNAALDYGKGEGE